MEKSLPSSWTECTLGDVVNYGVTRKAEPSEIPEDAWVLELEDIERDSSRVLQRLSFAERQSKSTKNKFSRGDILYGKLRPYLNKVVRASEDGYCSTEIIPLTPPNGLDGSYLFHWLKHPRFLDYVSSVSHGVNMPRLGTNAGREAPFVLSPLGEQKRIADKLDALFLRVGACQERLGCIPDLLKRLHQSVLAAATSGELTREWRENLGIDGKWPKTALVSVATSFSYGSSAKSSKTGKVPVLRMGNIQNGVLDWGDLVYTSDTAEIAKYKVSSGDVLFNRTNSPELVGKSAVFRGEREAIYAGYLIRVRCGEQLLPDYLNYCLGSPAGREYCWQVKSDGVNQSNINARKLAAFTFGLPSIEEQREITRRVENLLALFVTFETHTKRAKLCVARLSPSAIAKAFLGELVPQDPADEPASELLARLKSTASDVDKHTQSKKAASRKLVRAPKENARMTKSRQDEDVIGKPYLAGHLKALGGSATVELLFKSSELPVADFYKQLAWEVDKGLVKDSQTMLVASDAP